MTGAGWSMVAERAAWERRYRYWYVDRSTRPPRVALIAWLRRYGEGCNHLDQAGDWTLGMAIASREVPAAYGVYPFCSCSQTRSRAEVEHGR